MTSSNLSEQGPPTDRPAIAQDSIRRMWSISLALGLGAGVVSWMAGEGILRAYGPSLMPAMKPVPTMEDARLFLVARVESGTWALGVMGGLIGLAGGIAGGAARRSARAAMTAGGLGLVLGIVGLAGVARFLLPVLYTKIDPQSSDLIYPLLGHEAIWSIAGALGGLAFALGLEKRVFWGKILVGGFLGAALATVVYEFAGALGFPSHRTHLPIASSPETRAMAQILLAVGTAIGSVLAAVAPAATGKSQQDHPSP